MKLSKCNACGTRVSLFARNCPKCGKRVLHPVFGLTVAILLLVGVFVFPRFFGPVTQHPTAASPQVTIAPSPTVSPDESNLVLGAGTYTVGTDIDAGTYDCIAVSGLGVLRGDVAAFGEPGFLQTMGSVSSSIGGDSVSVEASPSYSNLTLANGDVLYIEMNLNVEFVPK